LPKAFSWKKFVNNMAFCPADTRNGSQETVFFDLLLLRNHWTVLNNETRHWRACGLWSRLK